MRAGVLILLALAGLVAPAAALESAEVDVYFLDQVGLASCVTADIQRGISQIYSHAGVRLRWLKPDDDAVGRPPQPERSVRIVLAWKNKIRKALLPSNSGRSLVFLGLGWRSSEDHDICHTVVLPYEDLLAASYTGLNRPRDSMVPSPLFTRVVTRAAAHEIGHVLLNSSAHSAAGLMRPTFRFTELVSPFHSDFWFGPEEAARLQRQLLAPDGWEGNG